MLETARESGLARFIYRDSDYIHINILNELGKKIDEEFKIIKIYEFSSERKLMTIVLKKEGHDKLLIFSKGADCAIFERLHKDD